MTTVGDLGERALIARIRDRVPHAPDWVTIGIGDDAAVIEPERNALEVVTTDSSIEGVHFDRRFMPGASIGHRALAVNLSDLASMGARPRAALLSLALPDDLPVVGFDEMLDGVLALAAKYRVALVGGNIARSPGPTLVDVTAFGTVQKRRVLRRSGAKPGDVVFVSGQVGAAAAGLESCRARGLAAGGESGGDGDELREAVARFLFPDPRMRLGWLLGTNRLATACMDLSDGLADAVHQVAAASGVGARIDAASLPIDPAVRQWFERAGRDAVEAAVAGGDDYELLFTVPGRRRRLIDKLTRGLAGVPLTVIGVVTRAREVVLRRDGGGQADEALPQGYTHFR